MEKKEKTKKAIIILLIILAILLFSLIFINKKVRTPEENFKYIYSEEMDEGTFSPEMIHVVIGLYEGEVNPKAITKASYYLITNRIPEYLRKCTNDKSTDKYFEKNKDQIYKDIGINSKEEFNNFIHEINKLSGNLRLESARFERESVKVNSNNTEAILKLKYEGQEEISLKVTIFNREYSGKPSIKFSK